MKSDATIMMMVRWLADWLPGRQGLAWLGKAKSGFWLGTAHWLLIARIALERGVSNGDKCALLTTHDV